MHWGTEYSFEPNEEQKELAQFLSDLGVDVIIGEHPHVIQPMDYVTGKRRESDSCHLFTWQFPVCTG